MPACNCSDVAREALHNGTRPFNGSSITSVGNRAAPKHPDRSYYRCDPTDDD